MAIGGALLAPACGFPDYQFQDGTGGASGVGGTVGGGPSSGGSAVEAGAGGEMTGGMAGSGGGTGGAAGSGATGSGATGSGGTGAVGNPALCNNGQQDLGEKDVDCGGPCDSGCALGADCDVDSDCASGKCNNVNLMCTDAVKVECQCVTCSETEGVRSLMRIRLRNTGSEAIPFDELALHYYYTTEPLDEATCSEESATDSCNGITVSTIPYQASGSTHLVALGFKPELGALVPDATTADLVLRLGPTNHPTIIMSNDYSYDGTAVDFKNCPKITLHRANGNPGGALLFGEVPPP